MSDEPKRPVSTPEDVVRGPRRPAGLSTVRSWTIAPIALPALIVAGAFVYLSTHPIVVTSAVAATRSGKAAHVDPGDVVAHAPAPRDTPRPTAKPLPTPGAVALSDVGGGPPAGSYAQSAPGGGETPPVQQPPPPAPADVAPQPPSAGEVAAQKRADADRAALDAPLPQMSAAGNVTAPAPSSSAKAEVSDVAPPSDVFLAPGTEIDVTLSTSIDSTVQSGQPGTIIGYTGRPTLDYYQRVVVIPMRSKIIGHLASATLQPGQKRVGAIWDGIILPNGHEVLLNAPGIGLTGTVGFGVTVDEHTRRQFVNVLAYSILAAGAQLAQPQRQQNNCVNCQPSVGQTIGQSVGTQIADAGTASYQRSSQAAPVGHVVEGAQVGVMITGYLPMRPSDEAR